MFIAFDSSPTPAELSHLNSTMSSTSGWPALLVIMVALEIAYFTVPPVGEPNVLTWPLINLPDEVDVRVINEPISLYLRVDVVVPVTRLTPLKEEVFKLK